ncbi:hypothetical protein PFISCL1PPCAC_20473 [Pristionchus fissidentatus]|uniref:Guided entry of tail-anchored proteins factor 1 n=1 Tax=Pristionchus fissidentatus TaxID=1538716 RepID=A0AAV5WA98_9BILA|nr:hypothetical protein PFISCL1PPCAC_20473 [Pristionchus fissidentatus]
MVKVEVVQELAPSPEWELMWTMLPWILTPIALLIHLYQSKFAGFLADAVRMFCANKEHDEKVRKLATELAELKAEQRVLSPVNDFALYFKKDRLINKLQEQYDQAVRDRSSAAPSSFILAPATNAIAHILALLLLNSLNQPAAACIPYAAFWPINGLLRFPSVFTTLSNSRCDELSTEVSLFVFLYFAVTFIRRIVRE